MQDEMRTTWLAMTKEGEDDSYSYDVYRMQHTVMPQHSKPWKGMEGNNKHKIARNNLFEPPDS